MRLYERYVAIGDSTSEGLDDPDGRGGYRGWANRFAEHVARAQGELLYANLAVRGRRVHEVREHQLELAIAMRPDLSTVVGGVNDLLRPRFDVDALYRDMEAMQRAIVSLGATVLTFTLPSLRRVLPAARPLEPRVRVMNDAIRAAARDSGALLLDFAAHDDVGSDPRLWSVDRLHANSLGHERIAQGLAHAVGVPGFTDSWTDPLPAAPSPGFLSALRAEVHWMGRFMIPWIWRHARGRSSGDGVVPKRPALAPVELTDLTVVPSRLRREA